MECDPLKQNISNPIIDSFDLIQDNIKYLLLLKYK